LSLLINIGTEFYLSKMKYIKQLVPLALILSLLSCGGDDEVNLDNLIGTWKFGSFFLDGLGATASGNISFNEDNTGEMDLWYIVENDTLTKQGSFSYTQTAAEVIITLNSSNMTWNRAENKSDEQEFHFNETINQTEYGLIFDLIPE